MKLTPATARAVRRLALDVVLLDGEQDAAPDLSDMARRAKALLDGALRERASLPRAKAPGATKAERRERHRTETGILRGTVLMREGGRCEACGAELGVRWEMHHVEQGGHRRSRQRPGSVVALCMDCHRRNHRGDLGTLAQIARIPSLDAAARRAVLHRIAKIEEARRTVGIRIEEAERG